MWGLGVGKDDNGLKKFLPILLLLVTLMTTTVVTTTTTIDSGEWLVTNRRRLELRESAREMFYHAYHSYMKYGYPFDELKPLECIGRGRDRTDPHNIGINDIDGDYSLTLVDSLDMLAILGDREEFEKAVRNVIRDVHFDIDSRVQVFEVTIRMMGGLLSAHLLATDPHLGLALPWYTNELLNLAHDLGKRLLPAFEESPTSFPFARVNLKYGMNTVETSETCTAGIGTLLVEFATLSRLTNDTRFEEVARNAMDDLWNLRQENGLFGNSIDLRAGKWLYHMSGVGAGLDSWYEYLLKAAILLDDDQAMDRFEQAYLAILQSTRDLTGTFHLNVHAQTGQLLNTWVDSLSAFFPGLQVLAGDLDNAIRSHLGYYHIWRKFRALPERYDIESRRPIISFYPLRPEFIESTYMLYQATRDPFYLSVGEMVLFDLQNRTRQACGFAQLKDVTTGTFDDRMESFFLAETLKYLYLLFDQDNMVNRLNSNAVFTTEGHFLPLKSPPRPPFKPSSSSFKWKLTCDRFQSHPLLPSTILNRPDFEYIRAMIGAPPLETGIWGYGICRKPEADIVGDLARRQASPPLTPSPHPHQEVLQLQHFRKVEVFETLAATPHQIFIGVLAQFGSRLEAPLTLPLQVLEPNATGCHPLPPLEGLAVLLQRGECDFIIKAHLAQLAGAQAVLVANTDDMVFLPTSSDHLALEDPSAVPPSSHPVTLPTLLITATTAQKIRDLVKATPLLSITLSPLPIPNKTP